MIDNRCITENADSKMSLIHIERCKEIYIYDIYGVDLSAKIIFIHLFL